MDPYYIDYSGESTTDETPKLWTHRAFKKYFVDTWHKVFHTGGAIPWTLKEDTLLSKMREEYRGEDLADMILHWHINNHRSDTACQFTNFYSSRQKIHHEMQKTREDFVW